MDDLDHSIHISEFDWSSFYEESEECVLLQAALACPDDSGLSDSEESADIDSVLSTREGDTQQSTDASTYRADTNRSADQESCARELQGNANEEEDVTRAEICLDVMHAQAGEGVAEGDGVEVTNAPRSESVPSSGEPTKDRNVQTGNDLEPTEEPDPLPSHPKGLNANETPATRGAASEAASSVPLHAEKERWFVTVNANPARKRAAPAKKKRRQKKHCDGGRSRSAGHDKQFVNSAEKNEERRHAEEGDESQSNRSRSAKPPSYEINASDSSQLTETSGEEEDRVPEKLSLTSSHRANVSVTTLTSSSQAAFTPPQLERAESDELDDSAEFLSTHSYDSESYLSAAESVEEHQFPAGEKQLLRRSSCPTSDTSLFTLPGNADRQQARTDACDSFILVAETHSEGDQSRTPELPLTFPSTEMSADSPPCNGVTPCVTQDASGVPTHQPNLSASGCSKEDPPSVPPVPDLTITPCPAVDTPETFAQAAGHVRPVYAISAFWDEMEKLTINDILQLRTRRSSSPGERQESVTQTEDSQKNPVPPVEVVDDSVSGSAAMDTSDAADSDYFTQADESKPDRSSCEFSTSDFEEEYWQFLGASRNASPDGRKRESDASFSQCEEEEESAGSEGRRTPVPSEDPAGPRLDLLTLSEPAAPRQIRKSRSLRNVAASATAPSLLDGDESGAFLSLRQSMDENVVSQVSDRLLALNPPLSLCSTDILDARYQISFPQVFDYFFSDDKANAASKCVKVYDPEDISVAPIFDFPFPTLRDEMSPSALRGSMEQPIPIFSCSPPTVRDLTFPKLHYAFLSSNSSDTDDFSPIRVVSQSYIRADQQGSYKWKSLLSIRKIRFHDKGSMWCGRSGVWMFPAEEENIAIREDDPVVAMLGEAEVCPASSQLFRELEEQQRILETTQTKRDGVFSTLKQSDMCLVCIAFASWVLKSSDPEADDTWKAALLANVSALSAIQYLRQYVMKKKRPPQDEP